jgi:hypothetical protein
MAVGWSAVGGAGRCALAHARKGNGAPQSEQRARAATPSATPRSPSPHSNSVARRGRFAAALSTLVDAAS